MSNNSRLPVGKGSDDVETSIVKLLEELDFPMEDTTIKELPCQADAPEREPIFWQRGNAETAIASVVETHLNSHDLSISQDLSTLIARDSLASLLGYYYNSVEDFLEEHLSGKGLDNTKIAAIAAAIEMKAVSYFPDILDLRRSREESNKKGSAPAANEKIITPFAKLVRNLVNFGGEKETSKVVRPTVLKGLDDQESNDYFPDLTTRGTPRVRKPMRSREQVGGDPRLEENRDDVKLGGRIPRELRTRFLQALQRNGTPQGIVLTKLIEDYLESLNNSEPK